MQILSLFLVMAEIELLNFTDTVLTEEHHTWSEGKKKDLPFQKILKEALVHRQVSI